RAAGAGGQAPRPWRSGELARWVAVGPFTLGTYGVGRVRHRAGAAWRTRSRAWPARRHGTSPTPPRIPSENVPCPQTRFRIISLSTQDLGLASGAPAGETHFLPPCPG